MLDNIKCSFDNEKVLFDNVICVFRADLYNKLHFSANYRQVKIISPLQENGGAISRAEVPG